MKTIRRAEKVWSYFSLTVLRVTFWLLVLTLFIAGLRIMSPRQQPRELEYAELNHQIDNRNVIHAQLVKSGESVIVTGELRDPSENFRSAVPDGQIETLAKRLGNPSLATNIPKELPRGSLVYWGTTAFVVFVFATIFFLLNFLIARFKRRLLELRTKEAR
ncbi:MAG: hypothetical protein WAN72_12270 [Candidatus Acidiferrales bacterium]